MIPEQVIEELKYRNDIESVISSYVNIARRGRNRVGLCPFHSEKTPYFTVYPDSQSFYCFGCGAGGDVVTFIRKIENLSYIDALRFLAKRVGMELPEDADTEKSARKRLRLLEMNRAAARFYHSALLSPAGAPGLQYLTGRGLTPKTIRHFGLGYASANRYDLMNALSAEGYTREEMAEAALISNGRYGYYDLFRNRVIFPIIDLRGSVIGFGGRILSGDGPKYLNSSDTPVYKKSRNLFALNFAKDCGGDTLVLAEGYMDVITLHQAGFTNAVATLGTALTSDQARIISQYAKTVVLSYDSDEAGQKATKRASEMFAETGVKTKVLRISGAKDPDEYIKKFGAAKFKMLLEGSSSATEYALDSIKAKYDPDTPDGRLAILKDSIRYISGLSSPVERDIYASRLAGELNVSKDAIIMQMNDEIKRKNREQQKKERRDLSVFSYSPEGKRDYERSRNIKAAVNEEKLIACMMQNPDCIEYVVKQLDPSLLAVEAHRRIFEEIKRLSGEGLPCGFTELNAGLSMEDIGKLSGIMASTSGITLSTDDVDHYINAIRSAENTLSKQKIEEMDDDEYLRRIAEKLKRKQGN